MRERQKGHSEGFFTSDVQILSAQAPEDSRQVAQQVHVGGQRGGMTAEGACTFWVVTKGRWKGGERGVAR